MKDLRPPTLQTYTDKTCKYINSRHIQHTYIRYTQGISYPRMHVDTLNTWPANTYTRNYTHTHTPRALARTHTCKRRLCNFKTRRENKSTRGHSSIAHAFISRPPDSTATALVYGQLFARTKGLRGPFSNIVGLKGKLAGKHPEDSNARQKSRLSVHAYPAFLRPARLSDNFFVK